MGEFQVEIIKQVGALLVSIAVAIITYYVRKATDSTTNKTENCRNAAKEIILPLKKSEMPYNEVKIDEMDRIIIKIEEIERIFKSNYLSVPPSLFDQMSMLIRRCEGYKASEVTNKYYNEFAIEIIKEYKKLRYMLSQFEKQLRKELGYPYDSIYGLIRYRTDSPILIVILLSALVFIWIVIGSYFLSMKNLLGILICYGIPVLAVIAFIIMIIVREKRRENKYINGSSEYED